MKNKILILFLLFAIAIPQVVSAAWWNPFSWFDSWNFRTESATSVSVPIAIEVSSNSEVTNEFDVMLPVTAALRECPSLDCKIIRYYPEAYVIHVVDDKGNEKWYRTRNIDTHGNISEGWMAKSVFSEKKKQTIPVKASAVAETQDSQQASGSWCNSIYYNSCVAGQMSFCPKSGGKALCINPHEDIYCQTDDTYYKKSACPTGTVLNCPATGQVSCMSTEDLYEDPYSKAIWQILDGMKEEQIQSDDDYDYDSGYESSNLAKCSSRQNELEAEIRAEVTAAGGFTTNSQVMARALDRMKAEGMNECFSGSGVIGGGSSTHCNYLNGGLDCTSSNGTRTYVNPIPGGGGVDVRSY